MIFTDNADREERLWYLKNYYPFKVGGVRNPNFDKNCGLILDLKEGQDKGINHFYEIVNNMITFGFPICTVPSSTSTKKYSGIRLLGQKLAENNRIDATHCLDRHTSIQKAANGGPRNLQAHFNSIQIIDSNLIKGREVLLLDDVTTSGSSLNACQEILLSAGAKKVVRLAIGNTTS